MDWVWLAAGLLAGSVVAWMLASARGRASAAAAEARATEVQRAFATAEQQLKESFKALASDALKANTDGFLSLAHERLDRIQQEAELRLQAGGKEIASLVGPVKESLGRVDAQIRAIETARESAYNHLTIEVGKLQAETGNLVTALRKPEVRGRWGEIQLKRVVEFAGMLDRCDFQEQASVAGEDGRLRPDLVVRLPGGKNIVVDSKVPLAAYLEALETPAGEARVAKLREHAQQVRTHMAKLGQKSYFEKFTPAPEFVVLFLPGEAFFAAALEHDPTLIEEGVGKNVILAAPTTLIAMLKAVHYGWKQETIAENALAISKAGQELYERTANLMEHLSRTGLSLGNSVEAFNEAIASFQTRVMPSARRLKELGIAGQKEVREILKIDERPRSLRPTSGM